MADIVCLHDGDTPIGQITDDLSGKVFSAFLCETRKAAKDDPPDLIKHTHLMKLRKPGSQSCLVGAERFKQQKPVLRFRKIRRSGKLQKTTQISAYIRLSPQEKRKTSPFVFPNIHRLYSLSGKEPSVCP